jgi:hypothetical protein
VATIERAPVAPARPPAPETPTRPAWRKTVDAFLTLIAGVLYVIGWAAGVALYPIWYVLLWVVAAVATGWADGSTPWRDS